MLIRGRCAVSLFVLTLAAVPAAFTQAPASSPLFSDMKWRQIGPMRAGRTRAIAGVSSEPATFYIGMVNGGVFKTTDAGETWVDIWEGQPSGSRCTVC